MKPRESSLLVSQASLTVECALVLPVFFLALLTVISSMEAIRMRSQKELALLNRAKEMAVAAGATSAAENSSGGFASGQDPAYVDLSVPFTFSWPAPLFALPSMQVSVRARVGTWSGGGIPTDGNASGGDDGYVFVTNNRSVYHTHADCTHLDLAVFAVPVSEISSLRNEDGRRYKKCRGFPAGYTGTVYATARGEYYYPDASFASLTRHVQMVPKSEVSDLHECQRCAARDVKEAAAHAGNAA
ncbi:MAG: hypothetical protein VZR02_05515 [Lachnospiraceae bacterium]|nr:hypothetical protein [Lachnospiraceae bacterium]